MNKHTLAVVDFAERRITLKYYNDLDRMGIDYSRLVKLAPSRIHILTQSSRDNLNEIYPGYDIIEVAAPYNTWTVYSVCQRERTVLYKIFDDRDEAVSWYNSVADFDSPSSGYTCVKKNYDPFPDYNFTCEVHQIT